MSTEQAKASRLAAVSEWLGAVQESTRMAVLLELAGGERSVAELAAAVGVAATNLSPHLRKLRAAGLV